MDISGFRIACILLANEVIPAQITNFDSYWDDEVHESFIEFNDLMIQSANKIDEEARECNNVLESIGDIDVPTLTTKSEQIYQKALSL